VVGGEYSHVGSHVKASSAGITNVSVPRKIFFLRSIDRWAEDRRTSLKAELAELDDALKEAKKAARLAPTLPEKLERQRAARTLEAKREEAWRAYDQASREIDRQKDALLDEIGQRLEQRLEQEPLFTLRWYLA
jgi:hypothetical protein